MSWYELKCAPTTSKKCCLIKLLNITFFYKQLPLPLHRRNLCCILFHICQCWYRWRGNRILLRFLKKKCSWNDEESINSHFSLICANLVEILILTWLIFCLTSFWCFSLKENIMTEYQTKRQHIDDHWSAGMKPFLQNQLSLEISLFSPALEPLPAVKASNFDS